MRERRENRSSLPHGEERAVLPTPRGLRTPSQVNGSHTRVPWARTGSVAFQEEGKVTSLGGCRGDWWRGR